MAACQSPRKGRSEPETHAGIRALGVLDLVFTPAFVVPFVTEKPGRTSARLTGEIKA